MFHTPDDAPVKTYSDLPGSSCVSGFWKEDHASQADSITQKVGAVASYGAGKERRKLMGHGMQASRIPFMPDSALNASEKKSAAKAKTPQLSQL